MKLKAHLIPLRVGKYYEQVLISFMTLQNDLYPSALVHIDTFWEGRDGENSLYNKLNAGEPINVGMEITIQ